MTSLEDTLWRIFLIILIFGSIAIIYINSFYNKTKPIKGLKKEDFVCTYDGKEIEIINSKYDPSKRTYTITVNTIK